MTAAEFDAQIRRLTDTFGGQQFKQERLKAIWREIQEFDGAWLEGVVDGFVATSRQAPLPADFAEAISIERDRRWKIEKERNAREAKEFMRSIFPEDEQKAMLQGILKRAMGQMPDAEWAQFRSMIDNAVANSTAQPECGRCSDTGLIWATHREEKHTAIFKCVCRTAFRDGRKYPRWTQAIISIWRPQWENAA